MAAIDQRKATAETDETTDVFTMDESQLISGRVVWVVMHMRELEQLLLEKVIATEWLWGVEEGMSICRRGSNERRG